MVSLDSLPTKSACLDFHDECVALLHIPHTPLICLLFPKSLLLVDQHSFLPVAVHARTDSLLLQHGPNVDFKTRMLSANTGSLVRVSSATLFVHTLLNFLMIFKVSLDYSSPSFEVHDKYTDSCLQLGVPILDTAVKLSFATFLKSASTIMGNKTPLPNLENVESANNASVEDQHGQIPIVAVKIVVTRLFNVLLGISRFWLKQNSLDFMVFHVDTNTDPVASWIQVIDLDSSNRKTLKISDCSWYTLDSPVRFIEYNQYHNYHILINQSFELWIMHITLSSLDTVGSFQHVLPLDLILSDLVVSFNPHSDLVAFVLTQEIQICELENGFSKIASIFIPNVRNVQWSLCGLFMTVVCRTTGSWYLYSRFGLRIFDSNAVSSDSNPDSKSSLISRSALHLVVSPCSTRLWLIVPNALYSFNLLTCGQYCLPVVMYTGDYLAVRLAHQKKHSKFPIPANFQRIIQSIEQYNGPKTHAMQAGTGKFTASKSEIDQFAISYGSSLSILTPFANYGMGVRHILWYNYKHLISESCWNIVHHFWFKNYLILFNRKRSAGTDILIDEIVVLNTPDSAFGAGGDPFVFNSDIILWRQDFDTCFCAVGVESVAHQFEQTLHHEARAFLMGLDARIITLLLRANVDAGPKSKSYQIYVGIERKHDMSFLSDSCISISRIVSVSAIQSGSSTRYLLMFDLGNLLLSSCVSNTQPGPNSAHLLCKSVERFTIQTLEYGESCHPYIVSFASNCLVLHSVSDLFKNIMNPFIIAIDSHEPIAIQVSCSNMNRPRSIVLVAMSTTVLEKSLAEMPSIQNAFTQKFVLEKFVHHELHFNENVIEIDKNYACFQAYSHCLELLLYESLANKDEIMLAKVIALCNASSDPNRIYVRCLRQIEIEFWPHLYMALETTQAQFMDLIVATGDSELGYTFLSVYLTSKQEASLDDGCCLSQGDKQHVFSVFQALMRDNKWDQMYELCRFIKLLDPSNELLNLVRETINTGA